MEPTAGEEPDQKLDESTTAEDTDEVPIVVPDEGDEQAISESPVGRHVAAARDGSGRDAEPEQDEAGVEVEEDELGSEEFDSEQLDADATPDDDVQAVDGDEYQDESAGDIDRWRGLAPLSTDDLVAMDPSALEEDLADDDADIVDYVEPSDVGPASKRRAEDLTSDTVLRVHSRPPQSGWRRFVYELTGGLIHPRLSRSDRARAEQLSLIRTLVTQPRRIAVLSRKGGVGKTTTTLMLGQTLARERGDRIIAVDGNPDAGSLGYRVGGHPHATITDLLSELDSVHRYADMRRFTAQTTTGLEVLMADDDPQITTALGDEEYSAVMSLLDRFYNLVLIDTGTGILDSAVQGILDGTDQIVLVVAPSLDAARAASQTLDWLTEHGYVELVETAVTVINQVRRSAYVDIARIEEHFWDRCGATVRIPWDQYLEAGAETDLADLRPATRDAYVQLAATVAGRFEALG
jgi:MinD-like ATPase involved in chromosome partitioning or flagellar assembly